MVLAFGPLVEFHPKQAGVPGRNIKENLELVRNEIKTRDWKYAAEVDIPSCFSNINPSQITEVFGVPENLVREFLTISQKGEEDQRIVSP